MTNESKVVPPPSLVASEDYKALNAEQRHNFVARLRYCDEIAAKAVEGATGPDTLLFDVVDEIELDASSIMGGFSDAETTVSTYRIHSSWTFECDRSSVAGCVPPEVAEFLKSPCVGIGLSVQEAKAWLIRWAELLQLTLHRFGASLSFTGAVAHLIMIDAFICLYLVFAATVRLSDMF
jgi:hypothetical protein